MRRPRVRFWMLMFVVALTAVTLWPSLIAYRIWVDPTTTAHVHLAAGSMGLGPCVAVCESRFWPRFLQRSIGWPWFHAYSDACKPTFLSDGSGGFEPVPLKTGAAP